MGGGTGPLWLCDFPGTTSTFASGSVPSEAVAECESAGLGTPASVQYAGYIAEPDPPPAPAPRLAVVIPAKADNRSGRRAELVLTLYGLLRCDWPIGSILRPADAAARLPTQSALRDFVANVGAAIQRIRGDARIVDQVIESQGNAWIAAAKEKNARGNGKWKNAEIHAERKIRHRSNAKRLRKRVAYRKAIGELALVLDGLLPRQELALDNFRTAIADSGLGADDIDSLVNRFRRITAPKL